MKMDNKYSEKSYYGDKDIMDMLNDYKDLWEKKETKPTPTLSQSYKFLINDKELDINMKFEDINNDIMIFDHGKYHTKQIEPLETILECIKNQTKIDLILNRNLYIIHLKGVVLKEIINILSESSMDKLKVKFEYDSIEYENNLLTKEEKRAIQLDRIIKKINK